VSHNQKGKTNLDFTEARDSEWQWHQLGHMPVCTSLQSDNHASTQPLSFLQAGCPSCRPTNSVKALKAQALKAHLYSCTYQHNSIYRHYIGWDTVKKQDSAGAKLYWLHALLAANVTLALGRRPRVLRKSVTCTTSKQSVLPTFFKYCKKTTSSKELHVSNQLFYQVFETCLVT